MVKLKSMMNIDAMRILVVEDSPFNAFCMTRLLQEANPALEVSVAKNSDEALISLAKEHCSLAVLDGDLGAVVDGGLCQGPVLAVEIQKRYPKLPFVCWTDNAAMRQAFHNVFASVGIVMDNMYCWNKVIPLNEMRSILAFFGLDAHVQRQPVGSRVPAKTAMRGTSVA